MRRSNKGFSLIEIMVGLAFGMLAMIVIMQVFSVFEGQKRTTTSGGDAQTNGALALYMIERDARMAGWGLGTNAYGNCTAAYTYCDDAAICGTDEGPLAGFSFASIRITDGDDNPDEIASKFFANPNLDTFRYPSSTAISKTMPQSSSELDVGSTSGCAVGGMALVAQGNQCTLMQITHVQANALKIQHNPGNSGPYNPPASYQNANGWPAYAAGATVSCFAPATNSPISERGYSIDTVSRQLLRSDNTVTPVISDEVLVPEIFDLQAQYGIADAGTQVVNGWRDATVDSDGVNWAAPTLVNWKRIKAVRVAVVARSTQYERPPAGGVCNTTNPTMDGTAPTVITGWSTWARFDTANYPADWKCYRYKVYETVVPLRNVMWGNL